MKENRTVFVDTTTANWPTHGDQMGFLALCHAYTETQIDLILETQKIVVTPQSRPVNATNRPPVDATQFDFPACILHVLENGWEAPRRGDWAHFAARHFARRKFPQYIAIRELNIWDQKNKPGPIGEERIRSAVHSAYEKGYTSLGCEFLPGAREICGDRCPTKPKVVMPHRELVRQRGFNFANPQEQKVATPDQPAILSQGAEEFLAGEIQPVEWAIEDIWPARTSGPLAGPEKVGKGWLALEFAVSLATGTPFLGRYHVRGRFKVLLWEEEDSRSRLHRRSHQLLAGRDRPPLSSEYFRYLVGHGLKLDSPKGREIITTEIEMFRPDFVVVGNLREIHNLHENDAAVAQIRDEFRWLCRTFHTAIVLIHHFRKWQEGQSRRGSQMLAGSGIWGAWAESWMYLAETDNDAVAVVDVGSKDAPQTGKLTVLRQDVTTVKPLALDEAGRAVWPVILMETDPQGRTDTSRATVLTAVAELYTDTPLLIPSIVEKAKLGEKTVRARLGELVELGSVVITNLPNRVKGYAPSPTKPTT